MPQHKIMSDENNPIDDELMVFPTLDPSDNMTNSAVTSDTPPTRETPVLVETPVSEININSTTTTGSIDSWKNRFFPSSSYAPAPPQKIPVVRPASPVLVESSDDAVFIVLLDDTPLFYTKTLASAKTNMWDIARNVRMKYFDYTTYLREESEEEIIVTGKYNNYVISYEKELNRLHIKKINEAQ